MTLLTMMQKLHGVHVDVFLSSLRLFSRLISTCMCRVHLSVSSLTADQNPHGARGTFCNFHSFFYFFFFFFKPWLIPKQQIAAVAGVVPHRWSSITS